MPVTIDWSLTVQAAGEAPVAISSQVQVDAYDRINVTVAQGAGDFEISVQPGGAGKVRLLLVRSSVYGPNLTYKVNAAANPAHALDDVLFLTGQGGVETLGFPPNSLLFSNTLGQDATIDILVGRQAS